jgi:hypothetical protein
MLIAYRIKGAEPRYNLRQHLPSDLSVACIRGIVSRLEGVAAHVYKAVSDRLAHTGRRPLAVDAQPYTIR